MKFYYTGKPCKHGHDSVRVVSNWGCYACSRERYKEWEDANHDYLKELKRASYYRKHDYYKKYARDYRRRHKTRYDWIRERRTYWLNKYKTLLGCCKCGWNDNPIGLDFHHKDREEKLNRVSSIRTGSLKTLIEEVRKCAVICANCHRILHSTGKDMTA